MVPLMNAKYTMDSTYEQQGSLEENRNYNGTYTYKQKERVGISGTHKEKKGLGNLTFPGHSEGKRNRGMQ